MPGKPEEPGPNPQSCDTNCSQSREWGHQGCLGHFQEGQEGHFQVQTAQEGHHWVFPQFHLPLVESVDGLRDRPSRPSLHPDSITYRFVEAGR